MEKALVWFFAVFAVLSLVLSSVAVFGDNELTIDQSMIDSAVSKALAGKDFATKNDLKLIENKVSNLSISVPEISVPAVQVEDKDSESYKEKLAVSLAVEALEDKDFKETLMEHLNANNASIEDEDDIVTIVVRDSDADVSGSSADVELELRVYFFNDGDSDDDAKESALVKVDFEVSGLKASKDFKDAEVDDNFNVSDFSFVKFYD